MPPALARIAILGTGNIAEVCHLPAVRAHRDQADVVAVADLDAGRAARFAATWDIPASYGDLATMLAAESLDLVIVCTPPAPIATRSSSAWTRASRCGARNLRR